MKKITLITLLFFACIVKSFSQWTNVNFNANLDVCLDIYFIDANTGFMTGYSGGPPNGYTNKIYRTTNGGLNWTNVLQFDPNPPTFIPSYSLHAFCFTSSTRGYCVGGKNGGFPFICSTVDGGTTWDTVSIASVGVATNVFFPSPNVGYVCGAVINPGQTLLLKTTDGGLNWVDITANTTVMNGAPINDIHFLTDNLGFVGTEANSSAQGGIYKTTDGGGSWTQVQALTNNNGIKALHFADATNGFASGTLGNIFKTTNGGNSWTPVPITQNQADVWDVHCFSSQIAYATGRQSGFPLFTVIYKTTNGGTTWVEDNNGSTIVTTVYYSLSFAGGKGYACGIGGYSKKNNAEVGMDELQSEMGLDIYPNPAMSELTIENGKWKIEKVELYNTIGELVHNYQFSTINYQLSIDLSQLLSGIYFITITDDKGNKVTRKVVKI